MKKRFIVILSLILLVSCNLNNKGNSFDADYNSICAKLKDDNNSFNSLIYEEAISEYVFYINEEKDVKITTYYRGFKEQFRYVYVLNIEYNNVILNNIRLACALVNDKESVIAQIGFQGDKKTISNIEDSASNTYKGLQLFISPYIKGVSKVRFYLEYNDNVGIFYEIDQSIVKEK